jgi:hypothetical protein
LTGIFLGIQAGVLTDKFQLNELKAKLTEALGPERIRENRWEEARDGFLEYVKSLPVVVVDVNGPIESHETQRIQLEKTRLEWDVLKEENGRLQQLIAAKAISVSQETTAEFEIRIVKVKENKPLSGATVVILRGNEVVFSATTRADGLVTPPAQLDSHVTLFVAHRRCSGFLGRKFPTRGSHEVPLSSEENIGSIAFPFGKGTVPGLPEIEVVVSSPRPSVPNQHRLEMIHHILPASNQFVYRRDAGDAEGP